MTARRPFLRKVFYLAAMAALLLPLSFISRPATTGGAAEAGHPGGKLAQLRVEHGLSQAKLGQIDPTSEAIKLATLGMRGIASNILWERARHYQMTKDWTNLSATLEQIIRLEPHFVTVWKYQGWNLSYNVSVEFDDYRDRYYWVIEGIDFLNEGTQYNENEPRLITDVGRFTAQKIGRADESKQFRRIFRKDDDFFARYYPAWPLETRDNWMVGRESYLESERVVRTEGVPIVGNNPLLFYMDAPLARINYSEALEIDGGPEGRGVFGDTAADTWITSAEDWRAYGARDLVTSFGETIRLRDLELYRERKRTMEQRLDELLPGVRQEIEEEKKALWTLEERATLETSLDQFSPQHKDFQLAMQANAKLAVSPPEIAARAPSELRAKADALVEQAALNATLEQRVVSHRGIVNYQYWEQRCEYEQDPLTVRAHELLSNADRAYFIDAQMSQAKDLYEEGFRQWRQVIDKYPYLNEDHLLAEGLGAMIKRYGIVLRDLGEPFPTDFVLQSVLDLDNRRQGINVAEPPPAQSPDSAPQESQELPQSTEAEPAGQGT